MKNPLALLAAAFALSGPTKHARDLPRESGPRASSIPRNERDERRRKAKQAKQSRKRNR